MYVKVEVSNKNNESNNIFEFKATANNQPIPSSQTSQTLSNVKYFPIPDFHDPYTNRNSIVDALKSIGVDGSLSYRITIANRNGIQEKPGTPSFNLALLALLKQGKLINLINFCAIKIIIKLIFIYLINI